MIFNKQWWKAAAIRALKTVAQTAIATIGTTAVMEQVNWAVVASASALAGVVYVCIRSTGAAVYNDLKDLVGIYVEVVS